MGLVPALRPNHRSRRNSLVCERILVVHSAHHCATTGLGAHVLDQEIASLHFSFAHAKTSYLQIGKRKGGLSPSLSLWLPISDLAGDELDRRYSALLRLMRALA